jgi:predicted metal-dependent phosphoesterase TrpH
MTQQNPGFIDLHIHSTASDGSLSPSQIIQAAKASDLKAISITDHDTLAGTIEALQCPDVGALEIIPGMEMSARYPAGGMHILGYCIQVSDPSLNRTLAIVQKAREERNEKIIEKLQRLGIDMHYTHVRDIAGFGQIGRPHFAQALIRHNAVDDIDDAFDRFLKKGRPAYASRYKLKPAEIIATISKAGGVAVLAHPVSLNATSEAALEAVIIELVKNGLKGMEVYYPDHTEEQTAMYETLARRHGLVMTGGTDFHGQSKPCVRLGFGKGDLRIPYRLVEALKACRL